MTGPPKQGSSANKGNKIILIKPANPDIFTRPDKIANMMKDRLFQDVVSTNTNRRKGLIVLEVSQDFKTDNLSSITSIGGVQVQCFLKSLEVEKDME